MWIIARVINMAPQSECLQSYKPSYGFDGGENIIKLL